MGAARIEIFTRFPNFAYAGLMESTIPLQIETETTSTSATSEEGPDERIEVEPLAVRNQMWARIQVDEACEVSIGADPTAGTDLGWLLAASTPIEVPVKAGDKFSFKDVA